MQDRMTTRRDHALRFARAEAPALIALGIALSAVTLFLNVADESGEAGGQSLDRAVLMAMRPNPAAPDQPWGPWWLHEAAADLTSLGGISVLTLFALAAVGFLLISRKWLSASLLVVGLAGGVMLSEGLKAVFERARPPAQYQIVETLNASFPSGHALLSTVFYLTLGVMLTSAFPQRRLKAYALVVAVTVAAVIGLTRIYLGAHWASDVIGGWCVGVAWAMTLWLIAHALQRFQRSRAMPLRDEGTTSA
ncbi:phosphoesterase [Brevundimonas sp. Leaf363]|nr:phosphoesterase [Brevundimonas sp. Leaf363]